MKLLTILPTSGKWSIWVPEAKVKRRLAADEKKALRKPDLLDS